ncbi:transporter substrate-binding domain-containing protein [Marinomonas sp. 15G1-11]|uniref:Transporter substrate-binding domain-containing protein n=1 Tax=Marinomonas phaeophyticola TaxID=3004091 RepID=A0ABT4JR56_9GAMM|nr:transporter substrate-binding domain-containing protein [Marinomonas sp. 15G1-11]MCZ2720865.1 transporter substrate-binding domain-containing protein [Marinomonas sp. 15G1-11]
MLTTVVMGVNSAFAIDRLYLATQIWEPYQTVDEKGNIGGIAVERVQCALRRMGQPYEIQVMSWDKAQLLVETSKMHGYFAGSLSKSRAAYAVPSGPVVSEKLSLFVSPDVSTSIDDETAKYNLRFGAKFNTNKWLSLKQGGYNVIKKPRDATSLLQMLWQGELDVALEYELVFEHSMKKLDIPLDYFKRIEQGTQDLAVHFSKGFVRQNPTFLTGFNKSLRLCL